MLHCYIPAWTVFCVLTGVAAVSPLVALLIMSGSMEVSPPGGAQQGLHTNRSLLCCNPLLPAPHCLTSRSRVPGVSRPSCQDSRGRESYCAVPCLPLIGPPAIVPVVVQSSHWLPSHCLPSPALRATHSVLPRLLVLLVLLVYWSTRLICVDGEGRRSVAAPAGWRLLECL